MPTYSLRPLDCCVDGIPGTIPGAAPVGTPFTPGIRPTAAKFRESAGVVGPMSAACCGW